ncbi:MAG: hypothetical protein J6L85_00095 [Clostridia bacterium]|nr:hypothetical protein [Clostridia bacterium]
MADEKTLSDASSPDSFSNALNSILSNPEMLSMISSMAEKLKSDHTPDAPDQSAAASSSVTEAPADAPTSMNMPDIIGTLGPLLSSGGGKLSKHDNDRACLLRALKPYLSHDRSQAIDYIIKFSSIAEVLKNFS